MSNKKYNFVEIQPGGFFSLQNKNEDYYIMPLSLPDRFIHFSINFLLEKESSLKNNRVDLCSLFLSSSINPGVSPLITKGNKYNYFIERFGYYNMASFDLYDTEQGDIIEIICGADSIFNGAFPTNTDNDNAKFVSNNINVNNLNYKSTTEGNKIYIYSKNLSLNAVTLIVNFDIGNLGTSISNIS